MALRVFCLVLCSVTALAKPAAASDPPVSVPGGQRVERIVQDALKEFQVPGAAIAIVSGDRRWVRTFGLADVAAGRPVLPRDHFAIRSITKSFVVTALLQVIAAGDGAIGLDDPIGKYLADVPRGDIITLRELANMTSGLFNYTLDEQFRATFGADPTRFWSVDELLTLALHSRSHPAFVFDPGTQYQYSNTNTLLLGKLLEHLTGLPFARLLDEAILDPLGLRGTRYLGGVSLPAPSVNGYQGLVNGEPDAIAINATSLNFAGAMASTIEDLSRWGSALADGTLLPAALQRERFVARPTAGDPGSPLYDRYGLGIGEVAGWWGHTGEGVGFEAAVFRQIDRKETIAILLNDSTRSDIPVRIFCRVLHGLGQAPRSTGGSVCDDEAAGREQLLQ